MVDDKTGSVRPAGGAGSSVVLLMVRDAYANYVVQTTLDVVPESEEKRLLLEELNAHADELVCLMSCWSIPTLSILTPFFGNPSPAQLHLRQTYNDQIEFMNLPAAG